jgi:phosphatidylglycerol---prolipoprotein diacylglyceryl transferase
MIPYYSVPDLRIPFPFGWTAFGSDHVTLHAFGLLVAIAVIVGHWQALKYAGRHGASPDRLAHMIGPMLVTGFIGAHLAVVTLYRPEDFAQDWWKIWDGLSSFGGFFGALAAMLVYGAVYRIPLLPYADAIMFGLAHGWIFGRAGCASVHDHPGRLTTFPLSIQFPPDHRFAGQRFDLGLLEMLYTIVMVLFVRAVVEKRVRRPGEMTAWIGLLYAPARFGFDFLRASDLSGADARYYGLTPAQYACIATAIVALAILRHLRREVVAPAARGNGGKAKR